MMKNFMKLWPVDQKEKFIELLYTSDEYRKNSKVTKKIF